MHILVVLHPKLADMITNKLKHKVHWAVSDYLQRAARHVASDVDVKQAYAIGYKALNFAKSQHKWCHAYN